MMGQSLFIAILFTMGLSTWAQTNTTLVSNLKSRIYSLNSHGSLIKSFPQHSQSYIYDQALAIITFTKEKNQVEARRLLRALSDLQNPDGSLYFSYYLDGKSPYPSEGDKRFAGAIAWVALAAVTYQHQFHSNEFKSFNIRILDYLASEIREVELGFHKVHAIRFAPADIKSTPWEENEVAALEHNLDAYAAFSHFGKINNDHSYEKISVRLKKFIIALWDSSRNHFWSGANLKTSVINKQELYLDNQTWSLLALDEKTLQELNAKEALSLNCDKFLVEHDGIKGFMDTKPTNRKSQYKFVWSEGSAGQILAMMKINSSSAETLKCQNQSPEDLLTEIKKMIKDDGGVAYATSSENPDFTTLSSVAGTTWFYFAANRINPFKL